MAKRNSKPRVPKAAPMTDAAAILAHLERGGRIGERLSPLPGLAAPCAQFWLSDGRAIPATAFRLLRPRLSVYAAGHWSREWGLTRLLQSPTMHP